MDNEETTLGLEVKLTPGDMTATEVADMLEKAAAETRAFAKDNPDMPARIVFDYSVML